MAEHIGGSGAIVVVHRDSRRRAALLTSLARLGGTIVGLATAEAALQRATVEGPPRLAVMHVGSGGLGLCRELHDRYGEDLPVILLSSRPEPSERVAGLLIGADDCMSEPVDSDELLARVHRSLRRAASAHQGPSSRLGVLSGREREILGLLAQGLTQKDIARQLVISQKTVATHVQHTLSKLGVHSRAAAVARALSHA